MAPHIRPGEDGPVPWARPADLARTSRGLPGPGLAPAGAARPPPGPHTSNATGNSTHKRPCVKSPRRNALASAAGRAVRWLVARVCATASRGESCAAICGFPRTTRRRGTFFPRRGAKSCHFERAQRVEKSRRTEGRAATKARFLDCARLRRAALGMTDPGGRAKKGCKRGHFRRNREPRGRSGRPNPHTQGDALYRIR
jgi:hypothetical protein